MKHNLFVFAVYVVLIAVGIPWYWPAESTMLLFGIPAWVCVAIMVSLLASIFTAWLLLSKSWDGSEAIKDE